MLEKVSAGGDPAVVDRKQAEADFHNQRARERLSYEAGEFQKKWSNKKFYTIARLSKGTISSWMKAHCAGANALDYCCGQGLTTIEMAKYGANAYGIDISDEEIKTARRHAAEAGVADRITLSVMDAERLQFDDNFFDLIVCNGVLHHLDVTRAYPELARVLKPGGRIMCIEALGYNPVINLYRKMTPHLRTEWEIKHILRLSDVKRAREHFGVVKVEFFHFFSILAVPFRNTPLFSPFLTLLEKVDTAFLKLPFVQLMAWQMIFILSEPRKAPKSPRV